MRVPLSQLRRFATPPVDIETLARVMNARVSEVEAVHRGPARERFRDVRIVELMEAHERRDGHTRWGVASHDTVSSLVIGDRYGLGVGDRVAAVFAGGQLPDGTVVESRVVAGLPSLGIVVSEAQLGLGKDTARPLTFAPEVERDADPWDTLDAGEVVLDFDLEPNRPDLFSLAGMGRDVSAIWGVPFTLTSGIDLASLPRLSREIDIQTPKARHYAGLLMRNVRVGPSPQWLQNAVRALGMRPLNNVVDAANLVMLELGQPLHTFDADTLDANSIVLRMATPAETITTLDGVDRVLTEECLLVCDGPRPVAIAGIMGDAHSEVTRDTTNVLVESAAFDMATVRRASRRLSLRTEASARFEKGLPIAGVGPALARLGALLVEVAGGEPVGLRVAGEEAPPPAPIRIDAEQIRLRLGMDVPDREIFRVLAASGCVVTEGIALAPEARPDLRIPEDLVEEIGRVHGYEHVQSAPPTMVVAAPVANPSVRVARTVRRVLGAWGWDEVYLSAWVGDGEVDRYDLDRTSLVTLINPLAEDLRYFRPTAVPGLVAAAVENRKDRESFALFEVGRVYSRGRDGRISERGHVAGIAIGTDLLTVRDLLLHIGAKLGADTHVHRATHPHTHPGQALGIGEWAAAGTLHPSLVRSVGLREAPVLFALDLERVVGLRPPIPQFVAPTRFPSVALDANVRVGPRVEAARVLASIPALEGLASSTVTDRFPVAEGARLTIRCVWNAGDRSLSIEEAEARMGVVRGALASAGFGA